MRHHPHHLLPLIIATLLAACDEGNIPLPTPTYEHGRPIAIHTRLQGIDTWGEGYNLVLATYGADADRYDGTYNISQQHLPTELDNRDTTIIREVDPTAATIELCIASPLRERIVTFFKLDLQEPSLDTLHVDLGTIDVSLYGGMMQLFQDNCAHCHGQGNEAQLRLDRPNAYNDLVGKAAYRDEFAGMPRVTPFDPSQSALHLMLDPTFVHTQDIGVNHPAIFRTPYPLAIIDTWIEQGATPSTY